MVKKIIFVILVILLCFSAACEVELTPNNTSSLVSIRDYGYNNLYYDSRTNIVYYIIGNKMTAYYCPHGLPYRFNSEIGELECINK